MTNGISLTCSIRCPLANTRLGTAVAATALAIAYLFSFKLILTCHFLHVFVGAKRRPPRHMFPNAAWPERWVPPPPTRGIRATALPVPQDSADVYHKLCCAGGETWWPALTETA